MEALATAVIQSSVDSIFSVVKDQVGLESGFKEELEKMKNQLPLIRSYLADTTNLESQRDVLKTSLKMLKDLMYEADDLLTDCCLRYEHTRKLSSERIMKPFFRYDMSKKLKNVNSRMEQTVATMAKFLTAPTNPEVNNIHEYKDIMRMFSSQDFISSEIIGLEKDLKKMKKWILHRESDVNRIGIVGMGGLGKTTIAQKVFNDSEVISHFEERIWVSVSQDFNVKDMLSSMLKQLGKDGVCDESQMLKIIQESLRHKSYLIMLDDVWHTGLCWWKEMCSKMPTGDSNNSCVIVTTRNEEIAHGMQVTRENIHKPKVLNPEDSWSLFYKHAFRNTKGAPYEEIGRKIAEKCGGLPLAIKAMGALLAPKIRLSEWNEVEANFHGGFVEAGSTMDPVMASLRLSYAELPTHLKQCLLSFSIYPEDAEIEAEQVIYWWVGEGLIQQDKKKSKTAIELGYAYLLELAQRCLIQVTSCRGHDGRVFTCKMHDLVRTLITVMAQEEDFCSFDGKGSQKLTLEGSRWLGLKDPIDEYNLSLMKKIPDPRLRALLLVPSSSSTCHSFDISDILELQLKSLRALDVSHAEMKPSDDVLKAFWAWITSLRRLAYLNLSGLENLKVLPRSIKKLRNLQLLVLRGCKSLIELHSSVTGLKQLIILDVGCCPQLSHLPRGIQNLSNLQELSGFRISNKSCFRFIDLQELANLRVLRIDVHDESVILDEELSALSKLQKLRVLSISYDNIDSSSKGKEVKFKDPHHVMNMLGRISPPPALQELYLKNYRRENLWSWINPTELFALRYLSIEGGNLVSLSCNSGKPWNIEGLCLKHLLRFQEKWETVKEHMPLIHSLEVSYCIGLQGSPCSGHHGLQCWNKNQLS